jgi:hypothetical protein
MPLILTGASGSTTLDSSAGLTFSDSSNQAAAASPYGLKNRIINGDMVIDQRNAGAATANTISGYTVDRWQVIQSGATGKVIVQQNAGSVTPPTGFSNYLGITSQSAYSVGSTDWYAIQHNIEGYNVADLDYGKATAKTCVLSFWVRSSLTGTFVGTFGNSASTRAYPFTYTISAANTWEQKTITVNGDTSGTWLTTNGTGLYLMLSLGMGSSFQTGTANNSWATSTTISIPSGGTSVVGTNGATFYLTGVQLERNTTATPFEWLPYSTKLAMCQRYYYRINSSVAYGLMGWGQGLNSSLVRINIQLPVTMRVPATGFDFSAANTYLLVSGSNNPTVSSLATSTNGSLQIAQINVSTSTSATVSAAFDLFANASAAAYVGVIAEL